ncbi:transporter [Bacillus sp. MKU004]|nr:transporter [Bacillus sp. MKU004]
MQKVLKIIYEMFMLLLVMVTIINLWQEDNHNSLLNWMVWGIFFADFVVRLLKAEKKWEFVKDNPFLVIAILPFDQFFQMARIVRVIYLFRLKTITKYYISPYVEKLTYQSWTLLISILLGFLLAESFIIFFIEETVGSFYDGIVVVFGHLIYMGSTIVNLQSGVSMWLLTVTAIIGISLQGLALQWGMTKLEGIYKGLVNSRQSK